VKRGVVDVNETRRLLALVADPKLFHAFEVAS
jgi:hypothetical protein